MFTPRTSGCSSSSSRGASPRSRSSTPALATSRKADFVTPLAAELAADVLDRFLRYARIDTQSEAGVDASPSTEKQLDLSRLLRDELEQIGLDDVRLDEHGYVYGSLRGAESAPA